MATKSDDMFSRLFSGDKPAAQDAPKREPKPKPESEAQPKPKAKPRKQGPQKPTKVDGSQLFGAERLLRQERSLSHVRKRTTRGEVHASGRSMLR